MTYQNCDLCPRRCGVDRTKGELGYCRCPDTALVAKTMLHQWEEPALAGSGGSGAIFFGGCTLGCSYCQNRAISCAPVGTPVDSRQLRELMEALIAQGAEKLLADYMGSCLEKTFADVHILSADSGKLRHIGAEDAAVVFSFPPYDPVVAEMAAHSRNAGAKVVGVTNGENAPIYTDCDHCLFANADNKPYGLSLLKPMTLVEELLAAVICGKDGGANEI